MGSGDKAQRAAEQAERERQAKIEQATARIDAVFDNPSRQAQYDDFVGALREFYTTDANRQKKDADRRLKFAMARSGLTGGSASVDAGRTLSDEYSRGIIETERRAQGSLADLMSQDEQSRLSLIQLAQSGLDAGTAASRAAAAMRTTLGNSRSASMAEGLGDIFGGTADIYRRQEEAEAKRRAQTAPIGSIYGGN